ncbi:MAG: hypothetical protein U0994_08710, partial [Gemmatimonadales bacterium]|nr:hypothetical protein [Gemmatimonadales bacterium]
GPPPPPHNTGRDHQRLKWSSPVIMVAVLAIGACSPETPTDPTPSDPSAAAAVAPSGRRAPLSTDQMLATFGSVIPGLTGVWFDPDSRSLVFAVRSGASRSLTAEASAEIASLTASAGWPDFPIAVVTKDGPLLLDLLEWRQKARSLANDPGMTSLDVDERNGEMVIGMESPGREAAMMGQLAQMGIPEAAVRLRVEPRARAHATVRDKRRPKIENGFQIAIPVSFIDAIVCTHGADGLAGGNQHGFITASHCSADSTIGTLLGSAVYQNVALFGSGNLVGGESIDPAPFTGSSCGPAPMTCRFSDAMFVAYAGGSDFVAGKKIAETDTIGTTTPGGLTIARFRSAPQSSNVLVGFPVRKTGRTTGTTAGPVINTCIDLRFRTTNLWLLCQDRFSGVSDEGDSGSPVYFPTTLNPTDPVLHTGILWGGVTDSNWVNFSPWIGITTDLGIFY